MQRAADQQGLSGRKGEVSLEVSGALPGTYTLCVTNVHKPRWAYDPNQAVETYDTMAIP